jgi:hypothetical protein
MHRRAFVSTVALSLLAMTLAAEAQPVGKVWRIGILSPGGGQGPSPAHSAFEGALPQHGWVRARTSSSNTVSPEET